MSEAASPTGLSQTSMVVPIANVSSLSQAWIDALGLARHQPVPVKTKNSTTAVDRKEHVASLLNVRRGSGNIAVKNDCTPHSTSRVRRTSAVHIRGRIADLERMRISKKIASIHPPQPDVFRRSTGRVTIISRKGIVRLLLQRSSGQLRITAVCDPRLISTITDSLQASRVAYAARGMQLQTSTYMEKNS